MRTLGLFTGNAAVRVKQDYPVGLNFDGGGVSKVYISNPWGWPDFITELTVDTYNATDFADAAEPADADHIMFSRADKQWKCNRWIAGDFGDVMTADIVVTGALGQKA